jgi:hypothetical protein
VYSSRALISVGRARCPLGFAGSALVSCLSRHWEHGIRSPLAVVRRFLDEMYATPDHWRRRIEPAARRTEKGGRGKSEGDGEGLRVLGGVGLATARRYDEPWDFSESLGFASAGLAKTRSLCVFDSRIVRSPQ